LLAELRIVSTSTKPLELPAYQQEWIDSVREVKEYTDKSGEIGGLNFGFDLLNKAFNGLQPAVYQIAGPSNVGKSALCLQLAWQVSQINENVYVIYFALDDRMQDIVPRIIAMDQRVPISCVKFPKKYEGETNLLTRRISGFKRLESCYDRFKLRDLEWGDTLEYIEQTIKEHKMELPSETTICIFIDNFFDIQSEKKFGNNNDKYEHTAVELERISTVYQCPIVCTAELRKLNGNRRPILDDIRETVKIIYKAKGIMLCYNEVGIRGQSADVYWSKPGSTDKEPLLEVRVAKNKLGEFKGRLFYEFWPAESYLVEVPEQGARLYNQRISV